MADPLNLLGLARKAGRLVLGAAAVEQRIKQGKAALLLMASDASPNTARRVEQWTRDTKTDLIVIPYTKEQFGRAMGRSECAVALLADEGFAAAIKERISVNC